jgi:hypothetical protein
LQIVSEVQDCRCLLDRPLLLLVVPLHQVLAALRDRLCCWQECQQLQLHQRYLANLELRQMGCQHALQDCQQHQRLLLTVVILVACQQQLTSLHPHHHHLLLQLHLSLHSALLQALPLPHSQQHQSPGTHSAQLLVLHVYPQLAEATPRLLLQQQLGLQQLQQLLP